MARLVIPINSQGQLKHVFKAEAELSEAGVTFDTGSDLNGHDEQEKVKNRVWELDWSLKGAELKYESISIASNHPGVIKE